MKLELRSNSAVKLRKQDVIPGVIYGKGIESTPIQVHYYEYFLKTLAEYGLSRTFPVTLGRKKHIVYFKEVQRDPMNVNRFLHFDLQKVAADDTITSDVVLHFLNREEIAKNNLILTFDTTEITVEYTVGEGVSSIEVDLAGMEVGDYVYVRDLEIPEGLEVLSDPDAVVAKLAYAKAQEEPEETTGEEVEVEVEAIKQSAE